MNGYTIKMENINKRTVRDTWAGGVGFADLL